MSSLPNGTLTWPEFHNGVAAGLRVSRETAEVNSTWMVYNKPAGQLTHEHAGFLMALGLQGHLAKLSVMNVYEYLSKGHVTTSIGLLLGLSASKRGSMDAQVAKMLCIHVPEMLPPTAAELDVAPAVQTAALLGIGLTFQGSAHRRMTEVLLEEIGRRRDDTLSAEAAAGASGYDADEREGHALAAGMALGLVVLQLGEDAPGVRDMRLADRLTHYIV